MLNIKNSFCSTRGVFSVQHRVFLIFKYLDGLLCLSYVLEPEPNTMWLGVRMYYLLQSFEYM
jgi:hypothetical protein